MTPKQGRQGTPMNAVEVTPQAQRRRRKRRERQEARWAARSGPVTVTRTEAREVPE